MKFFSFVNKYEIQLHLLKAGSNAKKQIKKQKLKIFANK